MAVAWPTLKDRLVALIPTLTPAPAAVYDGPVPTGDAPASYCCVGWQPSTDDVTAGSYDQTRTGPGGFLAEESGAVLIEYGAVTGDTTTPSAFALVDALHASVQADQSLGVLTGGPTASLTVEVVEAQNQAGAVQRLLVTLSYTCRLV